MKRFVTITLAVAWTVLAAASVPADTTRPKVFTTDDMMPASGQPQPSKQPAVKVPSAQGPVVVITAPASGASFAVGSTVGFTGRFTDDAGDVHSAQWSFSGVQVAGAVNESDGTVTGTWTFSAPGIYFLTLAVTDEAGHTGVAATVDGQEAMIVVFDRGYGFVDGKGRFDSPAGAFAADPQLTGRMDFDFDTRYRKDDPVPTGSTSFKFSAGNLDFQATACDWFDVNGARGLYKGTGTINGAGSFAFLLTAVDGDDIGGGAVDRLRIRITNRSTGALVYDNQMGAPDTALATCPISWGNVNVRLPNGGMGHLPARAALASGVEPTPSMAGDFELMQNSPNPFRASTLVRFRLPQRAHVKLAVFDVAGREVATLTDGPWDAGSHSVTWAGMTRSGERARRGVYFVHMTGGLARGDGQFSSVRKMIVLD